MRFSPFLNSERREPIEQKQAKTERFSFASIRTRWRLRRAIIVLVRNGMLDSQWGDRSELGSQTQERKVEFRRSFLGQSNIHSCVSSFQLSKISSARGKSPGQELWHK